LYVAQHAAIVIHLNGFAESPNVIEIQSSCGKLEGAASVYLAALRQTTGRTKRTPF